MAGTLGPISAAVVYAAALCRQFEGFVAKPYLCPAQYWTQGFGTVFKPDGTRVQPGDAPITREVAEAWLQHELRHNYIRGVLKASPHLIKYPQILGAIASFAYNLGVPRYRASTLRKRIDARDWAGAQRELMRWTRSGGKVLRGLVRRRAAECLLIEKSTGIKNA